MNQKVNKTEWTVDPTLTDRLLKRWGELKLAERLWNEDLLLAKQLSGATDSALLVPQADRFVLPQDSDLQE